MLLAATAAMTTVDSVTGRWITETRHGVVEITSCGTSICGQLIDSDTIRRDPQLRDDHNKDQSQTWKRIGQPEAN